MRGGAVSQSGRKQGGFYLWRDGGEIGRKNESSCFMVSAV